MRGCRCIEIDVHNGEATAKKSTESLATAKIPRSSSGDHKRNISSTTLASRVASAFERVDEKYASVKAIVIEKTGKGREFSSREERGRRSTASSLNGSPSIDRPATMREMMNGEPLVLHGWTLTAPIGFRAVCKTIGETAFVTSSHPIIVSLEVHADLEQQEVMVKIMKEEWRDLLIEQPTDGCDPDVRLPRLEELSNKILIKVKKAIADRQDGPTPSANSLAPIPTKSDADSIYSGSEDERGSSNTKKKVKICSSLSNLGIYTHSEHFVSFDAPAARKPPHIFSISENQIMELHETRKGEMFAHNRDFFMRAYPAGFRIDSSNLDPSVFWRKGVQMVAMNWQKLDEGMMLNEGMFAGEHGWVLKPAGYRSDADEPINYKTLDLKITVYAGQHIPIPAHQTERGFHPYVRCELHVEKQQEENGDPVEASEYKKKTVRQKGDHLDFGAEGCVMAFRTAGKVVEELSFVRLVC